MHSKDFLIILPNILSAQITWHCKSFFTLAVHHQHYHQQTVHCLFKILKKPTKLQKEWDVLILLLTKFSHPCTENFCYSSLLKSFLTKTRHTSQYV